MNLFFVNYNNGIYKIEYVFKDYLFCGNVVIVFELKY